MIPCAQRQTACYCKSAPAEAGRVVEVAQGNGFKIDNYKYDELGNLIYEHKEIVLPNSTESFATEYSYDSWGRVLDLLYPDEEFVRYNYKASGELEKIDSKLKGETSYVDIVRDIGYDGFGNMNMIEYGNGAVTTFTYSPLTQRLTNLNLQTWVDATNVADILHKEYTYDPMGRVTQVHNAPTYTSNMTMGGEYTNDYTYDAFNRLETTAATATFIEAEGLSYPSFNLTMVYNQAGGIVGKEQTGSDLNTDMTYDFDYKYDNQNASSTTNKKHQLYKITDHSSANSIADTTGFAYSKAGSIRAIAVYKTSLSDFDTTERYVRNEEQWLMGYQKSANSTVENIAHFVYDHAGERVLKGGLSTATFAINGQSGSLSLSIDPYTIYVNPYYVVEHYTNGDKLSKHYYMGMQRVATNLGLGGQSQHELKQSGSAQKTSPLQTNMQHVLTQFGMVEGKDYQTATLQDVAAIEDYYPETQGSTQKTNNNTTPTQSIVTSGDPIGEYPSERLMYFYHPDYLGNVEYITDMDGLPYQYFWYSPWGEALKDQKANTNTWETPYQFNGKELDDETGLYYYGARYYNPQVSVWLSVDPLAHNYPHVTPYNFVDNNPILLVDPDGRGPVFGEDGDLLGPSADGWKGNAIILKEGQKYNPELTEKQIVDNKSGGKLTEYTKDGGINITSADWDKVESEGGERLTPTIQNNSDADVYYKPDNAVGSNPDNSAIRVGEGKQSYVSIDGVKTKLHPRPNTLVFKVLDGGTIVVNKNGTVETTYYGGTWWVQGPMSDEWMNRPADNWSVLDNVQINLKKK